MTSKHYIEAKIIKVAGGSVNELEDGKSILIQRTIQIEAYEGSVFNIFDDSDFVQDDDIGKSKKIVLKVEYLLSFKKLITGKPGILHIDLNPKGASASSSLTLIVKIIGVEKDNGIIANAGFGDIRIVKSDLPNFKIGDTYEIKTGIIDLEEIYS